jgi:hypothetical protein
MKRTASDETRGPGAFGSAGAGASIANATRRSSIFAAPPCDNASAPPKYANPGASCSASAPSVSPRARLERLRRQRCPVLRTDRAAKATRAIAASHAIDVVVLIMCSSSGRLVRPHTIPSVQTAVDRNEPTLAQAADPHP